MPGLDLAFHTVTPADLGTAPVAPKPAATGSSFGFDDLLDIVNPLHHFPVVSTLYKHLSGDKIGVPEKILGDTLYGGLWGLASSVGDALFTEVTGKSVGDTVYAMVFGDEQGQTTAIASDLPTNPVEVKPASSEDIALPDFSFLNSEETATEPEPSPEVAQRALKAYHASSKFLSF